MRSVLTLLLWLAATESIVGQQAVPAEEKSLSRVREKLGAYADTLPNFTCEESVVSQRLLGPKIQSEMRIESSFRVTRSEDKQSFHEARTINLVDGQPPKDRKVNPPYSFDGGFANVLQYINDPCLHESLATPAAEGELVVIGTSQPVSDGAAKCVGGKRELSLRLASDTYKPLHMEITVHDVAMKIPTMAHLLLIPMPSSHNVMKTVVEYAPVSFGTDIFQLPLSVENTISDSTKPLTLRYIARYSNCRRFAATVTIAPGSTRLPD